MPTTNETNISVPNAKELRIQAGLSISELTRFSGLSRQTIVRIEKGERVKPSTANRLLKSLMERTSYLAPFENDVKRGSVDTMRPARDGGPWLIGGIESPETHRDQIDLKVRALVKLLGTFRRMDLEELETIDFQEIDLEFQKLVDQRRNARRKKEVRLRKSREFY